LFFAWLHALIQTFNLICGLLACIMKQKILVTGGAGFIGSHTVVELANAGFEPIIIDTFENSSPSVLDGLEKILGYKPEAFHADCAIKSQLTPVFDAHPDMVGVIHFAAYKAVGESVQQPLKYYHNNLFSTITLLEVMQERNIPHLAFSSSCTVYGQPEKLPVTEAAPVVPAESPYGNTKQICEEIIRDAIKSGVEIKALSLRYFNPIGAHPSAAIGELPIGVPGNLVPFVGQVAAGIRESVAIFGNDYNTPDGTCIRDYIHVVDLAKAHVKAIEVLKKQTEKSWFDFVNLGTGTGNSVLEVVSTFEKVTGEKLNWKFAPRRPGDVEQVWADTTKAWEMLEWKTELSLEQALIDTWRWQQKLSAK
jgi:UDP-glucose 4-epimerase